ncbi:MAG: DinB family protein [Flavobacteriales bacterium]|nr:DinB family protein [Flavobacteriia bacterium]NCP05375.1 DinB family protein [Flavobacteriales bacterium]PIV92564.1 MAG: DinB family protein [Flavobacteriaceae bacterium CG17_big_fil_post_rev_8_21_14_2_50_33_15]PIY12666.1 MAG: DinB family protein [Flavobacteriaceae bacterium CG_4_10_14_3_um_filter_33_47]PJB18074.1 MAG: DinB family protein [Flavobacteriaceae bacterium CG_4_9_14_3_um_filter_33_16]
MHFSLEVLTNTRIFFNKYLEKTALEDLNKIPQGFNNNIIWNVGHIVVTQQLLAYKLSGLPMMVSETLIAKYMKGTKPEGFVSQKEVDEIKKLLFDTIEQTKKDFDDNLFKNFHEYTVSTTGNILINIDDAFQFILFHEGIHLGYVMALSRAIKN